MTQFKDKLGFANQSPRGKRVTWFVLGAWFVMACYGWFFVELTVLRDSAFAQDVVALAIKCFPPLENFRKLGLPAEKALYLNSLCFFVCIPIFFTGKNCNQIIEKKGTQTWKKWGVFLISCAFFTLVVYEFFYSSIRPNIYGKLNRTGGLVFGNFATPISAPFVMALIWYLVGIVLNSLRTCIFFVKRDQKNG